MTNIVCFTQDVPGERDWINSNFPGFTNLETESSGKWTVAPADGDFIWEVPYTDPINYDFIKSLNGTAVKTIFHNNFDTVIHDNEILATDRLLINGDIKFENSADVDIKNYMMFTFSRCGTVFTESLLRKKYPAITADHYALVNNNKVDIVKKYCLDTSTLICLNYRSNWWNWITSLALVDTNTHLTERGVLHYSDKIDWQKDPCSATISDEFFAKCEKHISDEFNFWIQLRLIFPERQFKLFRFEDILPLYSAQTNHKQVPYDKTKLITNYAETKQKFEDEYLPRWQIIEQKALKFLSELNVTPTTNI